ncbi:hypothetical protein CDIK_3086 [Cucumispora dikerogammari]|nr:hypothetical protein CDIK_3086 [Cucumispora dikerogammari]
MWLLTFILNLIKDFWNQLNNLFNNSDNAKNENIYDNKACLRYDYKPFIKATNEMINIWENKDSTNIPNIVKSFEIEYSELNEVVSFEKINNLIDNINKELNNQKQIGDENVLLGAWKSLNDLKKDVVQVYEKNIHLQETNDKQSGIEEINRLKTTFITKVNVFLKTYKDKSNQEIIQVTNEWGLSRIKAINNIELAEHKGFWEILMGYRSST